LFSLLAGTETDAERLAMLGLWRVLLLPWFLNNSHNNNNKT
jgi:hypothetical protein